jgi:hypothetical protein
MFNPFKKIESNAPPKNNETAIIENETEKTKTVEQKTPENMRFFADAMINLFCKKFTVEGLENVKRAKEDNPEEKYIISSSHAHNLDVPATLKALGEELNIQVSGESLLLEQLKYLDKKALINLSWGRENFTAIDYKDDKNGKRGLFNPDNFFELEKKMQKGKTPWIASQPFSIDKKIKTASIGSVYLAAKAGTSIIPTALDTYNGGSINLEGPLENAKGLIKRSEAVYHIGKPIKFPFLDISIIEKVIEKRRKTEPISPEEQEEFRLVHQQLKERAEILSDHIFEMLPPEKDSRG